MSSGVSQKLKQAWFAYTDSFDAEMVVNSCRPLPTAIAVLALFAVIGVMTYVPAARALTGFNHELLAAVFVVTAGIASLAIWFAGVERRNALAFVQLLEVSAYVAVLLALASGCSPMASIAFSSFYALCCIYWGSFYGASLIGTLPFLLVPLGFELAGKLNIVSIILVGLGSILYISGSFRTEHLRRHVRKAVRSEEIVNRLDALFEDCHAPTVSRLTLQVSSLAHALRHDLTRLVASVEDAEHPLDPKHEHEFNKQIEDKVRRATQRLDEMQVGIEASHRRQSSVVLADLLSTLTVTTIRNRATGRIALDQVPATAVPSNASVLRLVLQSMVDNAFEAGATLVTLGAELTAEGETVVITLADNGPGLAEPVRENLFKPYVTWGKKHGVGLGLYLAGRTFEALGGKAELASTSAEGTVFRIALPVVESHSANQQTGTDNGLETAGSP